MRKMSFALPMGTHFHVSAPRKAALLLALAGIAAGCSGSPTKVASHSASPTAQSPSAPATASAPAATPTSSPSASPQPVTGSYGVLVDGPNGTNPYTVSIVGIDGKVVASAQPSSIPGTSCGNAAAVVPLPVSTSNSTLYFMDGQGAIWGLSPGHGGGRVTSVPAATSSRRSMFAVSPDDRRMAVVVADFSSTGASTRLYVENMDGTGHADIFSETGASTLWPIGWHGTNDLVLATVPACTQGGGPFCCGPQELHVVDPATAARRFTLGSASSCVIAGSPSPAGVVCERRSDFSQGTVLNWTAGTVRTLALNGPAFAYLSPDGGFVAMVDNTGTSFTIGAASIAGMFACGWIDNDHVLSGGDSQHQPRVAAVVEGKVVPVPAQGDCGGRIPGGL